MATYLLYESSSGFGLFEAHGLDEIGQNTEAVRSSVSDLSRFGRVVQLTAFHPFESALDALNQVNAVSEGKLFTSHFFLVLYVHLLLLCSGVSGNSNITFPCFYLRISYHTLLFS